MPLTPRGRGKPLNLDLPKINREQEEESGYREAAIEPPIHLSPKKVIPCSLKSTERRLSISEEEQTLDSESLEAQSLTESLGVQSESPKSTIESLENANESAEVVTESSDNSSESVKIENDATSSDIGNEPDPLMQFKVTLLEKPFIICCAEFLVNPKTTEVLVNEWIEYTMRMSLTSTDFCITFASYFKTLTQHTVFGKMIKKVTIDYLQEYYEERTTNFQHKQDDFYGSVILLGQIFLRYQIKGKPLRVFAQPLLEYLLMICDDTNEESIKIVAEQISLNGKALESIVPETMTRLMVSVQRRLLVTTSDSLRTWLLLVINLCFYGQPLTSEICEIFSTTIGINTIQEMVPPSADELQGKISEEFVEEYGSVFPE